MLRLTLDLVPFGIETHKRSLFTVEIINVGHKITKEGKDLGRYKIRIVDEFGNKFDYGTLIKGHDRRQTAFALVRKVVNKLKKLNIMETKRV